jgi:ElaB/YqjD/DUF883 family membrane-anchored ribosome-binding protein
MAIENKSTEQSPTNSPSATRSERPQQKSDALRQEITGTRSMLPKEGQTTNETREPSGIKEEAKQVMHQAGDAAREGVQIVRDARGAAVDSLRHAKQHAFDSLSESAGLVGERARVAAHTVSDFVATHAIPLALIGTGAGWLLMNMSHQRRLAPHYRSGAAYGYDERGLLGTVRERAGELGERATSVISRTGQRIAERAHDVQADLGERAAQLGGQVRSGAQYVGHEAAELGHQAYDGAEWVGTRAIEVSEKNPLTVGLIALAAGAAVAMLLPSTRRENQLLGQTRDHLMQSAQRSAQQLKESVQSGVERVANDVREVIDEVNKPGSSHG